MLKSVINRILSPLGIKIERSRPPHRNLANLPDSNLYKPYFSPWEGIDNVTKYYSVASPRTLVSRDRCYVLSTMAEHALQINGEFWECGVYKGGTAAMFARILDDAESDSMLRLFDTFEGMPEVNAGVDQHKTGDFSDTNIEKVRSFVGRPDKCSMHAGLMPATFCGLEGSRLAFAHVDVDIYKSILDCCEFIWPRLVRGGILVFDDYGIYTCPGARMAVDEYFSGRSSRPLCLPTGQALVIKSSDRS